MDETVARLRAALGDEFEIERELGGGGMSRVFVARERSLERRVVIKVLPPEFGDPVSAERFRREVTTIAKLQHPHIVPVLGANSRDGLTWYTMPFVEGEALGVRVKRDGALPVDFAVSIMREVADALAHAHSRGIVHRDIKPANILIESEHAVLADFGIAGAMLKEGGPAAPPTARLTATGSSIGTIGYMAPEQFAPDAPVDARADIYALGVVGYEMLTGQPMFGALHGAALMAAHVRDVPPAPHMVRPSVPVGVSQIVMRALAKDPTDRFQSAAEMRDALIASGGTATGVVELPVSAAPRSRGRLVAIVAAVVGIIGVAAWFGKGHIGAQPLDDNQIAVAPFDVLSADLALWKDGMVDVLSRNLDGMGPLRSAPPSRVLKVWSGRADAASAQTLGEKLSARLVVVGTLQPAGRDSVRATALIIDASNGKSIADVEMRGESSRMDEVADTLTVRLVSALSQVRPVGAARLGSIGSRSLPAIKEFLQGEQFWRVAQWDSARAHYEHAAELDTNFALAYSRIANAIGWSTSISDAGAVHARNRSGSLNHGLSPRDSLLLLNDSLSSVLNKGTIVENWNTVQRLANLSRVTVERYPQDADAWYERGEVLFHYGWEKGVDPGPHEAQAAFDRAVALDSNFVPAYPHLAQAAMQTGDLAQGRTYFAALRHHGGTSMIAAADLGLFLTSAKRPTEASIKALADTISPDAIKSGDLMMRSTIDPDGAYMKFTEALLASQNSRRPEFEEQRKRLEPRRAGQLAARGMFAAYDSVRGNGPDVAAGPLALVGVVPPERVTKVFDAVLADPTAAAGQAAYGAVPFLLERKDATRIARLDELIHNIQKAWRPKGPPAAIAAFDDQLNLLLALHEAFRKEVAGDTAGALRIYAATPSFGQEGIDEIVFAFAHARLLAAAGKPREALDVMNRFMPPLGTLTAPVVAYQRAQIAEAAGDKESAIEAWALVANTWGIGDASVQPVVKQARDALARLGASDRAPAVQVKR